MKDLKGHFYGTSILMSIIISPWTMKKHKSSKWSIVLLATCQHELLRWINCATRSKPQNLVGLEPFNQSRWRNNTTKHFYCRLIWPSPLHGPSLFRRGFFHLLNLRMHLKNAISHQLARYLISLTTSQMPVGLLKRYLVFMSRFGRVLTTGRKPGPNGDGR